MPTARDFPVRNHKKVPLDSVISLLFSLEEINHAFERAEWAGRSTDVIRAALVT
jgi:hypothetical protein